MFGAVKDRVVGQAMRLMSDPRLSRVMGDQRVMNVAMKAVGVGGSIKAELDRATRFAAGVLGFATQEEVSALRSTIQALEDNLAILESRTTAGGGALGPRRTARTRPPNCPAWRRVLVGSANHDAQPPQARDACSPRRHAR